MQRRATAIIARHKLRLLPRQRPMLCRSAIGFLPLLALAVVVLPGDALSSPPSPAQSLVTAYDSLGLRLFQDLARSDGNIVLSPYSIGVALSMAQAGARGETAKVMSEALGLQLAGDIGAENSALMDSLRTANGKDGAILNVANALIEVKPGVVGSDYRALLQKDFDADVFPGDVGAINQWIAQKTGGKIPHMLGGLSDD